MTIAESAGLGLDSAQGGHLYLVQITEGLPIEDAARPGQTYLAGPRDDGSGYQWFVILPSGSTRGWGVAESGYVPTDIRSAYAGRRGWYIERPMIHALLDEVPVPQADMPGQIGNLTRQVEIYRERWQESQQHVERIRDGIIAEAKERQWCAEVNTFLRGVGLDEWLVKYRVTLRREVEVEVPGCDGEDEAISQAFSEIDLYNDGGWDADVEEDD